MRTLRSILPRVSVFRSIAPRQLAPLLPTTRTPLTNSQRPAGTRLFTHFPARLNTTQPPSPQIDPKTALPPDATLSQKLKHLIKSYGWYALGVYLIFGALDFGVAFLGVQLLGAEYVSSVAASAKEYVVNMLQLTPAEPGRDEMESMSSHGSAGNEGLLALILLAWTVHKTLFLPLRVGLTAAFTPRIVSWLSKRGWAGTAGARRAADRMREKIKERQNK